MADGLTERKVYVPSGYVIEGLQTEKVVEQANVFFDTANGVWVATFDSDPGKIQIGVKPAEEGELPAILPIEFINEEGNILNKEQIEKNLSLEERKIIKKRLLGLNFYSTNPNLSDPNYESDNFLKTVFLYWAGECEAGCMLDAVISYQLGLDMTIETGWL